MEKMLASVVVGSFIIILSYFVGKKGNLELLHSYHWKKVKPKDYKVFAKYMGCQLFVIGLSMLCLPVYSEFFGNRIGELIMISILCLSVLCMILTTIKYNGSLFGKKL